MSLGEKHLGAGREGGCLPQPHTVGRTPQQSPLWVVLGLPSVVRGIQEGRDGLPEPSSVANMEVRNTRSEYSFSIGYGIIRHLLLCCSCNSEIPKQFAFCFSPFRILWLFLALFLGLVVALSGEEQGDGN